MYRDSQTGEQFLLTIRATDQELSFEDPDGMCRETMCGARGAFEGEKFALKARRKIRYMPRILASSEYKTAVEEFNSGGTARVLP